MSKIRVALHNTYLESIQDEECRSYVFKLRMPDRNFANINLLRIHGVKVSRRDDWYYILVHTVKSAWRAPKIGVPYPNVGVDWLGRGISADCFENASLVVELKGSKVFVTQVILDPSRYTKEDLNAYRGWFLQED